MNIQNAIVSTAITTIGIAGWIWMIYLNKELGPFPMLTGIGIGLILTTKIDYDERKKTD